MLPPPTRCTRRKTLQYLTTLSLLPLMATRAAQAQSLATVPVGLPEFFAANTVDAVLSKMQPPVTAAKVTKSDYLLLDVPDIALAGTLNVRMMSEIPGTDLFLLFDTSPRVGMPSILAAVKLTGDTIPDVHLPIHLNGATELRFLARASGRLYSANRDIKIATKLRR